ncbi:MAG: hypothetical protein WCL18_01310 [bacterium]
MNYVIYVSIVGVILAFVVFLWFTLRKKRKRSSISRICLENFLGELAKSFEKAKLKYITEYIGPKRSDDEIATVIANDLSESLAEQLQKLLKSLKQFKKEQERTFSSDKVTNHFIDKMIPNLAALHGQYSTKTLTPSVKDCKDHLLRIIKIKTVEVLRHEQ